MHALISTEQVEVMITMYENPRELEKILREYDEFTNALRSYGHELKTESLLGREKVVEVTPIHQGKARTADELITHLHTVLNHSGRADEIRKRLIAVLMRENGERKMAEWQLVHNLRLIRSGLVTKTQAHIADQIQKINALLPKERRKPVTDIREARGIARLTGLFEAYKRFALDFEKENRIKR